MSRNWFWAFAAVLLLVAAPAFGASQNAALYGTVYDASGNPMPGVTVTLENPALAFSRTTTSGSDGTFNFAEVPPAENYRLTASQGGKKLDVRTGFSVNVGDERVILPPLRDQAVAATAQVVEKTSERAVTNETASTTISGVITGDQLRSLPLYNRNFLVLGLLTPNSHDVEANNPLAGASFSLSGNRPNNNNFLLDGVDNVASNNNQSLPFQVNDSIQEFRVASSAASAEYGRNQGGTVNVVTRRAGTNFHGSVFGYFGSDTFNSDNPLSLYNGGTFDKAAAYAGSTASVAVTPFPTTYNDYVSTAATFTGFCTDSLDAFTGVAGSVACANGFSATGENTFFDPAAILATNNRFKQPFSSQQFGVNMGGAVLKDKLFLFGSYEGTRINNPNQVLERVPSTFDRTFDPFGIGYGLESGLGALDPGHLVAANVMALYPTANVIGVPGVLEFFQGETENYTRVHNGLLRLDYVHSDKSSWTFRYAAQGLNQLHDATLPATGSYPGNGARRNGLNQNLKIAYNHVFSPTLLNDLHFGITRFDVSETPQDAGFDGTSLGLPSSAVSTFLLSGLDPQYSGAFFATNGAYAGWNDFLNGNCTSLCMAPTLDGFFPYARIGAPLTAPSNRRDTTWFIGDGVSWSKGKHAVKFGADFQHFDNRVANGGFSRGYVVSSDIGEFSTDSLYPFFGGGDGYFQPSYDYALRQNTPYDGKFHSYAFSAYVQDTWRFHPRWTLNFGLRYEYFSPPEERNDQIWNFDPLANGLVQQGHNTTIDPFGNPCAATANYDVLPDAFNFVNGWTCNPVGSSHVLESDTNNFSPRFGLAWDVWGNGKTVIRAGYGLFYDHLPISYLSPLMFNRPTPKNLDNPQFILPEAFGLSGLFVGGGNNSLDPAVIVANNAQPFLSAASPFAIYGRDVKNSHAPFSHQYNATIQQQITNHLVGEIGYVGNSGRRLPAMTNDGFANQWFCTSSTPFCDNNSYFPYFILHNQGESHYHSLLFRARIAGWHGLRANATYSWSKSIDNASSGYFPVLPLSLFNGAFSQFNSTLNPSAGCLAGIFPIGFFDCTTAPPTTSVPENSALTTGGVNPVLTTPYNIPQDPLNYLKNDVGRSDFDSKHRFVLDYSWEVPGPKDSLLKGNWMLSGIFVAQSGQPFTIFIGPVLGEINQRVNLLGPVTTDMGNPNAAISTSNLGLPSTACALATGSPFISSGSLFTPPVGTACTGNSGRNQFTGPNFITFNTSVQKGFRLGGENRMLSLRAEFYNLFNRSNFYNPISTLSLDSVTINPDFGRIKSAHDPRQIQFGVRYSW